MVFCSGVWYGVLVRGKRHIAGLPWAAQPLGPTWGACHEEQRAQKERGLGPRRRRAGAEAWCQLQRAGALGAEPSHIISPSLESSGSARRGRGAQWGPSGSTRRGRRVGARAGGGRTRTESGERRCRRAGALAQGPRAREPGEVELGGGAGRAEGGGEGGGAGSVFGAPRQGGWRPPVRAGRCVCALSRSGRKMAQKGKLG